MNPKDQRRSGSITGTTPEPNRRRHSFLHLHLPETNWRGSLTHLHLPTFSVTTPDGDSRRFHFGIRRHSHNTLHRSESMVSLCYRTLTDFINNDNYDGFKQFLESKQVQLDDRDENGGTALMLAASKGRSDFVRELLAHDADVNAEDADNWTALLCASKEGHLDICLQLIEHGAEIEHRDMGGWSALMWATYKGYNDIAELLLENKADVNAHGNYHVPSLLWAAGRGHLRIVELLVAHGAKVNMGDKYGTTALIWASRKGNADIVKLLLRAGSNVDTAGMYSWTALLVATQGNHEEVVNLLLEHKPNVNALDKDGCSALTIACKEGYHEIASALLNVGAYINIQDRVGDTNLIHAVKGGHRAIVEALLKKYADVNITGKDRKTATYIAVEKGHVAILKLLLNSNPDLEITTKDGDTPLLKAVRSRNADMVQLLIDKKAKVAACDKKGDTALHIAMRAQSKAIVEILVRNPKHSHLLYRPNRAGETPYNIDMNHQKTILGQVFGARRLNRNEDNENLLGYDLYNSALADILSEPSLSMPITVGLYAKWGSGKSFLLSKLREEMKNFAREWSDPSFQFTSILFLVVLHFSLILGTVGGLSINSWIAGTSIGGGFFLISYFVLALIGLASDRYDWDWRYNFKVKFTRKMNNLKLILQILFCHPPSSLNAGDILSAQPIRFYFTDQTRVSSTTGGENSVVQMIGSLYDAIESDYGSITTRLYRAFKPKPAKSSSSWKWRKICCIPYVCIFEISFACILIASCALTMYMLDYSDPAANEEEMMTLRIILIITALVLCIASVANLYTWTRMFGSLVFSQRRHLQRTISKLDTLKSEGFLQALRHEVNLMKDMVKCLDSLRYQQTRLVIVVDGLDSCEQDKVLLVLDAVHMLFSDTSSPFIVILAIDPHVIAKAVELNTRRLFNESNIGGHSYLNNMVHLPFYLQNSGLRKVKIAQQTALAHKKNVYASASNDEVLSVTGRSHSSRKLSSENVLMSSNEKLKFNTRKGSRKLKLSDSVASSIGSNLNKIGGAQDLTKMLLTDDYFSDVNPRSMRRLMNVVYITGRLLKAFQIDFNWYRLASWINITEQRRSMIILQETLDDNTSLKSLYDKVRPHIPNLKDTEPLLELDRDEHKLDIFLTFHKSSLLVKLLKIFLPFTINLDPYLKKVIKEETQNFEDDGIIFGGPQRPISITPASINTNWPGAAADWTTPRSGIIRRGRTFSRPSPGPTAVVYPQTAGVLSWPQQWGDPMTMPGPPAQYPLAPVTTLSPEVLDTKLSTLNVDGVCRLLDNLDDLSPVAATNYKSVLHENNINGRVLLHCDLDELKKILKMNFGDWEMFRVMIVSLREHEMTTVIKQDESKNTVRFTVSKSTTPVVTKERRGSIKNTMSSNETDGGKIQNDNMNRNKQSVIEKQVTLEDQMICGALQTLNEEACEDIIEESKDGQSGDTDVPVTCVVPPSPDNIQDIITTRSRTNSTSGIGETDFVMLQASPVGSWQPVSISVQGNTESLSDQSSICSTPQYSPVLVRSRTNSIKMSLLSSNQELNDLNRKPKHVVIRTESFDNTKLKTFVYYETKPSNKTKLLQEYNAGSSQARPSTLQLKNERMAKYRTRSKSIDNSQKKSVKQSSTSLTHKLKEKFLHSSPELNENASDNESTPLVSSSTKTSNSIPLSPLSVQSITPDKDDVSLDINVIQRNVSLNNLSGPESLSGLLSPEIKPRFRTLSDSEDGIRILDQSKPISASSVYCQLSKSSLHLSRQDALDSEDVGQEVCVRDPRRK
ncbi:Ankyrin repeats (3 copies) [Popillia japonica]|uniref:Ankyrin repeats (3 copies) n=1 Tax=Popillia japonica TaxID=7064 RepID=A0AAW1LFQ3_POPJA